MPGGFYDLNKEGDTFSFRFSHEYCIIYRIYCTALRDGGGTMERGNINIVVRVEKGSICLLCFDVGKVIPLRRLGCVVNVVFGEQKEEKAKK